MTSPPRVLIADGDASTRMGLRVALVAGGFALSADRATFRLGRLTDDARLELVEELGDTHRPVLAGLAVVVASGLAMLLADLETLRPSTVFWVKMGAFALLLVNGLTLQRAERRCRRGDGDRAWRALRAAAVRSAASQSRIIESA